MLLERTDDETVSSINADVIYSGALSNSGSRLALVSPGGREVFVIDAVNGWPAGTSSADEPAYGSMELVGGEWKTRRLPGDQRDRNGNPIIGTPGWMNEQE